MLAFVQEMMQSCRPGGTRGKAAPAGSCARAWRRERLWTAADLNRFLESAAAALDAADWPSQDVFAVRLALEEAVVNAFKHAHHGDPTKVVSVWCYVNASCMAARVEDQGTGFDPEEVPDPVVPENRDKESGRGLLLMRSYMTGVRHNARGNAVTLWKHRSV